MSFPTFPLSPFANLPPLTIVPNPVEDTDNFLAYFNRFYEEVGFVANNRVIPFYTITITSTATDIPNIPQFGAFLVMISGIDSTQPVKTWSLVKSTDTGAGIINILGTQVGTGAWAAVNLTITSTATNFQIAHTGAATLKGQFNISVMGTQLGNQ